MCEEEADFPNDNDNEEKRPKNNHADGPKKSDEKAVTDSVPVTSKIFLSFVKFIKSRQAEWMWF